MPIYEYECDVCGATEEYILPIEKKDIHNFMGCSTCKTGQIFRTISTGTGFKMKGYSEKNGYSKGDNE